MAVTTDFEKELATKYAQLLDAKQKLQVQPDEKGIQWKYAQLELAYQDTMVKSKLPRDKIQTIEDDVQKEHDKVVQQTEQFKQTYKEDVLEQLQPTKEETKFKESYKQQVMDFLNKEPSEKESSREEDQKREQDIKDFEEKHGYEKVYELKREVLDEIREMDLTSVQKKKLTHIEDSLEKEKNMKLGNVKDSQKEQEMEM
ncbi:hypothetical protein [Virgibacillus ihumii]|uniref:hypothetical protein n=1 Tax=Virgibacillus ihumii TaxID=2686091 RepID=UPI00157D1E94|nr:hypothetical protein [Virgibacillus ihumii]